MRKVIHQDVELTEITYEDKYTIVELCIFSATVQGLRRTSLPLNSPSFENIITRFQDNFKLTFS